MTDADAATDWRLLREFAGVDLTKSFVLSWELDAETLLIDIDLNLTPDHAFYEVPRPSQKACIRPAVIEFRFCESIDLGRTGAVDDQAAAIGELGHGVIAEFRRLADGRYEISGEFGAVLINAARPVLRIKPH